VSSTVIRGLAGATVYQWCPAAVAGRFLRIDLGVHLAINPADFWLGSNGVTPASSEMKEVSGDLDPRLLFVSLFDESFRPGLIELTDTLVANGEIGLDGMRGWAVDGRLDLLPKGSREAEIFERSGRVVSCGLS
jgi:hypothetical protein